MGIVPMRVEQVKEAGLSLKAHNIVALERDKASLSEALKNVPRKRRPQIKPECQADAICAQDDAGPCNADDGADCGAADIFEELGPETHKDDAGPCSADDGADRGEVDIFEELGIIPDYRTFVHYPAGAMNFELSERSEVTQSEPSGGSGARMCAIARRLSGA